MLTAAQYTAACEKLEWLESSLSKARITYDGLITREISEYELQTGEAGQRARRIKLQELADQIEWLEGQIEAVTKKISGNAGDLVSINVRRR